MCSDRVQKMNVITALPNGHGSSVRMPEGYSISFGWIGREYTNAYSLGLAWVEPGGCMPMRASACNQAFFVISGEGLVTLADMHNEIFPGAIIKVPCGVLYELRNTGEVPMRMLVIHDPPPDPTVVWDCEEPVRPRLAAEANAAGPIKAAEVVATGAVAWKTFEAVGVQGYELKPMILGSELTDAYSIDLMCVTGGGFSAAHTDQGRHAFFIIKGQGRLTADGQTFDFRQDDIVKVPQGSVHELHNHTMGPLEFLAIYDPPRRRKAV